jgi:hypothetical protein
MPAATAADSDWRFPEIASRAAAHEGAPAPWSATPVRIASRTRRSAAEGRRPRCSRKIVSVKVRPFINAGTSNPRRRIWPSRASTMAVRQGSMVTSLPRRRAAHREDGNDAVALGA